MSSDESSGSDHDHKHHRHKKLKVSLPPGVEPIGDDIERDYWQKHTEFKLWLLEGKRRYFDKLTKKETDRYFRKFVKKWNRGKLASKYYSGVNSTQLESSQRSSHKWKFKVTEDEKMDLAMLRDSVDTNTHHLSKEAELLNSGELKRPSTSGSKAFDPKRRRDEEDPDDRRRKVSREKVRDKEWREEVVENVLGPKATGRDAMVEKRKIQREQRMEREASPDDADAIGGDTNSDYQRLLRLERMKREQRAEVASEKVAELQAKERARMEAFKRQMGLPL